MTATDRTIRRSFVRQQDQSDCGVACLATLVRFYGGDIRLEKLRELSGTDREGTTMLGLMECAHQIGFDAEGYQAEIVDLKQVSSPCILHVEMPGRGSHYLVCYHFDGTHFQVTDPAAGPVSYLPEELKAIWKSGALLMLEPNPTFKPVRQQRLEKWRWFMDLIEPDANILAMALILGILVSILSLSVAIFSQKLIDDILPDNHLIKLEVGLTLLAFLLFAKVGLGFLRQFFLLRQKKDFNNRIVSAFYSALVLLPKSFFDNRKSGDLIARLNDTARIQTTVNYLAANLLIDILLVAITLPVIFFYSSSLGVTCLVIIPIMFLLVYLFHKPILTAQREVMEAYASNESNFVDTIQGISTIKAQNLEKAFSEITTRIYHFFQEKILGLGEIGLHLFVVSDLIGTLFILIIIYISSHQVLADILTLGAMMAILQMAAILLPSTGRLAMINVQLQEAYVAFDRMFEFTSVPPEYQPQDDDRKIKLQTFENLKVTDVTFRFPGREPLLENISMEVRRGELVALLGESGCGKTTTLQVLAKFYPFEEGQILVNGLDWEELSVRHWRTVIGLVPQDIKIFNTTLLNNICLDTSNANPSEVINFLVEHHLHPFFEGFPNGYATPLGESGQNISGGQKQLIAIARALYRRPQLLLLDEPTSAMDSETERKVFKILKELRKEMGILLVTHRLPAARTADRIYVIRDGRIEASGPHEELLGSDNFYSLMWQSYRD